MIVNELENESTREKTTFSISYIDKNEAMYLLGLLRHVPCSHCPDFYRGCEGSSTLQESAMITEKDFMSRHFMGTEAFLCGKLRNIVILSKAEEQELQNTFESDFNKRVSLISQKGDDSSKYVLVHDKDEFNSILKSMEHQMIRKIQDDVEKINKHNASVVHDMQEKIAEQSEIIREMQSVIRKLKRTKNVAS
jgi:hypothetical protein